MITNARFADAGGSPGQAAGWTLRSACAREAIAAFTPGESIERFERWSTWIAALETITHAPFAPNGTIETFESWPLPTFALEMTPGLLAETASEAFNAAWWTGVMAFAWSSVPQVGGLFEGAPQELFAAWRPGDVYAFAFAPTALAAAAFKAGAVELFDGAAWTTKNTTLG